MPYTAGNYTKPTKDPNEPNSEELTPEEIEKQCKKTLKKSATV